MRPADMMRRWKYLERAFLGSSGRELMVVLKMVEITGDYIFADDGTHSYQRQFIDDFMTLVFNE